MSSTAFCVLGMHRSGTSALARVANLLGVDLGGNLMAGSVDNPKGFWEQRDIVSAHNDLLESLDSYFDDFLPLPEGWQRRPSTVPFKERLLQILHQQFDGKTLWGFKDPRTCRLLPLWHDLLAEMKAEARFVLLLRDPDEIARSLAIRNGYAYNKALLLTFVHMLEAERHTRGHRRVIVNLGELMGRWSATMEKIGATLSIQWPNSPSSVATAVGEFLDSRLRHHRAERALTAEAAIQINHADPDIARWVWTLYDLLQTGAAESQIDKIAAEFNAAIGRLSAWRQLRSIDQQYMKIEAWGVGLNSEVQRLAKDNDALRLELARRPSAASPDNAEVKALEQSLHAANKDITILRQAVADRDATISQLETRVRELDLATKWPSAEKNATGKT